jgi:hypothetical protein
VRTEFNLLAFGDIGQIDVFNKRNAGKLYSKAIKEKESPADATKKVHTLIDAEKIINKNNKCTMKVNGKPVNPKTEGYVNFNRLLCASSKYIKNSDQITILGDLVYAESKGLPINGNNLLDKETQHHMERRTNCGMNWFRDMMKNYKKYCPKGKRSVHKKLWSAKAKRLHQRFYILEGNHAFDVNYKHVSSRIASISLAKAHYIGSRKEKKTKTYQKK